MKICPQCNMEYQDNMKFCPECGSKLEAKPNVCPNCGTEYKEGQKFCSECGAKLSDFASSLSANKNEEKIEEIYKKGVKYYEMADEEADDTTIEENYIKAYECFLSAAEAGHSEAMYYLGCCYKEGDGVLIDLEKAFYWYFKAALANHKEAQMSLGSCYYFGYGVETNYEEAIIWFSKAAEDGSIEASKWIGNCYSRLKDSTKAIEWYIKAAKSDAEALYNIGELYQQKREFSKAVEWYTKAANSNYAKAQMKLGDWYFDRWAYDDECFDDEDDDYLFDYEDEDWEPDYEQAIKWYLKAANADMTEAIIKLGDCYNEKNDIINAFSCYEKVTLSEDSYKYERATALYKLGVYYLCGLGKDQNHTKAYECYREAAEIGDYWAKEEIDALFHNNGKIRVNAVKEKVLKDAIGRYRRNPSYYKTLAEKGDVEAQYTLGNCLLHGETSETIRLKAYYWYQKAAETGHSDAQCAMGHRYLYAIGCKRHLQKAISWYNMAAKQGNIEAKFELATIYNNWCYCQELRINYDPQKYFEQIRFAAESEYPEAQYFLANEYESGSKKNVVLAYQWYKRAQENGHRLSKFDIERLEEEHPDIRKKYKQIEKQKTSESNENIHTEDESIEKSIPYVFFIKAVGFDITYPDGKRQQVKCGSSQGEIPSWTGTGFLLADGRFVTARHVVEAWSFPAGGGELDEGMVALNIVANNGGKVVAMFVAISSNGTQIQFTSDQCTINRRNDKASLTDKGAKMVVANVDDTDYAYFHASRSYGLPHNNAASTTLARGAKLVVLGFPLGIGANSENDINPILGSGIVAAPGLQKGVILTTDTNYEQGNSGGPVFKANSNGDLEVIGLVSAGAGRTMGFIVPIAAVK